MVTGSVPGWPRQTGQVCVLGASPNDSAQPQNIFVFVSELDVDLQADDRLELGQLRALRGAAVEVDRLLERVRGVEDPVLAERRAGELEADRQALAEARPGSRSPGCPASDIGTVQ